MSGWYLHIRHDTFIWNPSRFILHRPSCHAALCSELLTASLNKQTYVLLVTYNSFLGRSYLLIFSFVCLFLFPVPVLLFIILHFDLLKYFLCSFFTFYVPSSASLFLFLLLILVLSFPYICLSLSFIFSLLTSFIHCVHFFMILLFSFLYFLSYFLFYILLTHCIPPSILLVTEN
jgi:hypothetical protein